MAKQVATDMEVKALRYDPACGSRPMRVRLGPSLYMNVAPPPKTPTTKEEAKGAKSWVFRFMLAGRSREMGLGPYPAVSLADATKATVAAKELLRQGRDPIEERGAERARQEAEEAARVRAVQAAEDAARRAVANPFREVALALIEKKRPGWRNAKHAAQWKTTLTAYAFPMIGDIGVAQVEREHILSILEPIWKTKAETAHRLRARIEAVLDYAVGRGFRRDDVNPATLAAVGLSLNGQRKAPKRKVRSHPALPFGQAAEFMEALGQRDGIGAKALGFAILTAARSGEVLGAKWQEFDLAGRAWRIGDERMKAGREHRVPLSAAALAVLQEMQPLSQGPDSYVFPGERKGKPLSNMALEMALRRLNPASEEGQRRRWCSAKGEPITVHGFRSTFRDWVSEATSFPQEMAEMALAHSIKNKTEAAYRRGDLFEKRRRMMEAWAAYCTRAGGGAKVINLRRAG